MPEYFLSSFPMELLIEPADPADLPAMVGLLKACGLPPQGLADHLASAFVARADGGAVVGCAALERYADGALLRSVAVAPALRGTGLGRRLAEAALRHAAAERVSSIYLLTETAVGFFTHLGFRVVDRDAVAPGVREAEEFTTLCPSTATVMVRTSTSMEYQS
jgi:amino-acid N-acetyltransferase